MLPVPKFLMPLIELRSVQHCRTNSTRSSRDKKGPISTLPRESLDFFWRNLSLIAQSISTMPISPKHLSNICPLCVCVCVCVCGGGGGGSPGGAEPFIQKPHGGAKKSVIRSHPGKTLSSKCLIYSKLVTSWSKRVKHPPQIDHRG